MSPTPFGELLLVNLAGLDRLVHADVTHRRVLRAVAVDDATVAVQLARAVAGQPGDYLGVLAGDGVGRRYGDCRRNTGGRPGGRQQFPMMNTQMGQAFLQACSDCHQPPSPAMHLPGDWDASLGRMEQYARGSGRMQSDQVWQAALDYVKTVSAQIPASTVAQYRQSLDTTVEHLKSAEGDAAYYPSVRDPVLDPAWAERVAAAYNAARALPAELLAATPTACQECLDAGNTSILECLNAMRAITCETAIKEVEKLVAEYERNQ